MGSEQVRRQASEESKAVGCVIAGAAAFVLFIVGALGFAIGLLLPW